MKKTIRKGLIFAFGTVIFLLQYPSGTLAQIHIPDFYSCPEVHGEVVANYETGLHAIVGLNGLKSGSDKVFSTGSNNYTQCYCPLTGTNGIQTNWFAAGSLSKEEVNNLITQGWTNIQNGTDWGLDNQPYLAKNNDFSCQAGGNGGSGGQGGSANNSSNSSLGQGGSEVLGISYLAPTSSPQTKYQTLFLILLGLSLTVYGIKIQNKNK